MARNGPTGRRGSLIRHAAIVAALACPAAVGAATASGSAGMQEVRYGGYEIEVPASWPVYDLAHHPTTCVRFDRHAVYLGHPGADQRCPAHSVGHTETVLVEPLVGAAPESGSAEL